LAISDILALALTVYADGTENHIPPESIDNDFIGRLADFMQKMA